MRSRCSRSLSASDVQNGGVPHCATRRRPRLAGGHRARGAGSRAAGRSLPVAAASTLRLAGRTRDRVPFLQPMASRASSSDRPRVSRATSAFPQSRSRAAFSRSRCASLTSRHPRARTAHRGAMGSSALSSRPDAILPHRGRRVPLAHRSAGRGPGDGIGMPLGRGVAGAGRRRERPQRRPRLAHHPLRPSADRTGERRRFLR